MSRTIALGASLALICLLGVLTLLVAFEHGVDPPVVVSLLILALPGFAVFGALSKPPENGG